VYEMEIKVIKFADADYPSLLRETSNPPKELFVHGKLPDVGKICITIVGTRKAMSEGRALAKKIGKACAEKGWVVVSGLAMGIDTAAHEGALEGGGETVAVLGCGVDIIYPAQNENLAKKILSNRGAIISEYENGTPALPHRFLERNRIVAGLSVATIVIEAPAKSGALVTARLSAEYGREVFVFPGMAGHSQYRGSHALIRDGARLVNSFEDILEDLLGALPTSLPEPAVLPLLRRETALTLDAPTPSETKLGASARHSVRKVGKAPNLSLVESGKTKAILEVILKSKTPLSVNKIVELTNLEPQTINRELSELLINRIIEEEGFGYKIVNSH